MRAPVLLLLLILSAWTPASAAPADVHASVLGEPTTCRTLATSDDTRSTGDRYAWYTASNATTRDCRTRGSIAALDASFDGEERASADVGERASDEGNGTGGAASSWQEYDCGADAPCRTESHDAWEDGSWTGTRATGARIGAAGAGEHAVDAERCTEEGSFYRSESVARAPGLDYRVAYDEQTRTSRCETGLFLDGDVAMSLGGCAGTRWTNTQDYRYNDQVSVFHLHARDEACRQGVERHEPVAGTPVPVTVHIVAVRDRASTSYCDGWECWGSSHDVLLVEAGVDVDGTPMRLGETLDLTTLPIALP